MSGEADVERMEDTMFRARYKMKMVKPIETVTMMVWLIHLKEGRKERKSHESDDIYHAGCSPR